MWGEKLRGGEKKRWRTCAAVSVALRSQKRQGSKERMTPTSLRGPQIRSAARTAHRSSNSVPIWISDDPPRDGKPDGGVGGWSGNGAKREHASRWASNSTSRSLS